MKQLQEMVGVDSGRSGANLFKGRKEGNVMRDLGLLVLRLTVGGLLAGHGAQKLFGWFGGFGLKGTAGWIESLGLKPGQLWAAGAALSEFGGGTLTALGLFHPLGPIATMGAMVMATTKVHWGKPIWAMAGGAELPVTNMAAVVALALDDPGRFSLDRVFGIRVPRVLVVMVAVAEAVMVVLGIMSLPAPASPTEEEAGAKSEGGQKAGAR
jgi:putative oxidoreductase